MLLCDSGSATWPRKLTSSLKAAAPKPVAPKRAKGKPKRQLGAATDYQTWPRRSAKCVPHAPKRVRSKAHVADDTGAVDDDVAEAISIVSYGSEFKTEDEEMVADDAPFVPRRKMKTQPRSPKVFESFQKTPLNLNE